MRTNVECLQISTTLIFKKIFFKVGYSKDIIADDESWSEMTTV